MNNILENYEKTHLESLINEKTYPSFHPGDTVKVHLKVKEGEKERIQVFEGVCIAKKNAGINSSFTVRKISYGEGIERVLPLFSPQINKIELVKSGVVRRSKFYYLRKRSGKSARISEKNVFNQQDVTKIAESSPKNNKTSEGDNSINNEVKASHKEKLETKKDGNNSTPEIKK